MPGDPGPVVRRRLISACLRYYREKAGLTAKEAAEYLVSDPSKITRLEKGERAVSARDVRDLCVLYEVPDAVRDELMTLARGIRGRGWWQRAGLDSALQTLIGMEGSAKTITEFEVTAMPGILQTREYADSLLRLYLLADTDRRTRAVDSRMKRQEILNRDIPPSVRVVLDEAVLHRAVGGLDVLKGQLDALAEFSKRKEINLQIIPFGAGAHRGMTNGFTVLQIPKPLVFPRELPDPGVVYLELSSGQSYLDDPEDVSGHLAVFEHLSAHALPVAESVKLLQDIARSL